MQIFSKKVKPAVKKGCFNLAKGGITKEVKVIKFIGR